MALTITEETALKKVAAEKIKQEFIDNINTVALASIKVKQDEIKVIDDKRLSDIDTLNK